MKQRIFLAIYECRKKQGANTYGFRPKVSRKEKEGTTAVRMYGMNVRAKYVECGVLEWMKHMLKLWHVVITRINYYGFIHTLMQKADESTVRKQAEQEIRAKI